MSRDGEQPAAKQKIAGIVRVQRFGAVEIPRRRYTALLDRAIALEANFAKLPMDRPLSGAHALEIIAERS